MEVVITDDERGKNKEEEEEDERRQQKVLVSPSLSLESLAEDMSRIRWTIEFNGGGCQLENFNGGKRGSE